MNKHRLLLELDRVASRFRLLRFWQGLAAAWLIATMAGLAVWGLKAASSNPQLRLVPARRRRFTARFLHDRAGEAADRRRTVSML